MMNFESTHGFFIPTWYIDCALGVAVVKVWLFLIVLLCIMKGYTSFHGGEAQICVAMRLKIHSENSMVEYAP